MADERSALVPAANDERSPVMDAVRGFAVLGILAMNIPGFAFPGADLFDPRVGGFEGSDRAVWWFGRVVFDMKMQSLFSMLFGAGLMVQTDRALRAGRSLTPTFYRRVLVLAVMGLLHGYLLWYGDILWMYAFCGALIYPLRRLPTGWLLAVGLALFLFGAVITSGAGAGMWFVRDQAISGQAAIDAGNTPSAVQKEMIGEWTRLRADFEPSEEELREEVRAHRGSYVDVVRHRAPEAFDLQVGVPFWLFIWRFMGYMLIGVALMRLGIFDGSRSSRFYAWMMAAGYSIGLPIVILGGLQAEANGFDFVMTFVTGWQWNYLGSLFVALGHIGALVLLFRSPATGWIVPGLAATGRMALTNYLSQSLLCSALFFGWGAGLWDRLSRTEVAGIVIAIWAVQITWSVLWLRAFRFGPMEWLWRTLTYGRVQPMLRGDQA